MSARGIPAAEIESLWINVERPIQRALKHCPLWTLDYIKEQLLTSDMQLFLIEERSVVITRVLEYPGGMALELFLASGSLEDARLLSLFEAWAQSMGCEFLQFSGRLGWKRQFPDYDYEITMRKQLCPAAAVDRQ